MLKFQAYLRIVYIDIFIHTKEFPLRDQILLKKRSTVAMKSNDADKTKGDFDNREILTTGRF